MKEFKSLSEKWHGGYDQTYFLEKDVKEFIKLLKEEFENLNAVKLYNQHRQIINKLAGDKLI